MDLTVWQTDGGQDLAAGSLLLGVEGNCQLLGELMSGWLIGSQGNQQRGLPHSPFDKNSH